MQDFIDTGNALRRPYANYPHDWRAIQICSGLLIEKLRHKPHVPGAAALRHSFEAEREVLVTTIEDQARDWFNRAASHAPFDAVPQAESDQFWSWLADKGWIVRFVITDAVTMSIEASLVESHEAAARIPDAIARRLHGRHALVVRTAERLFVTTSDRN